MTVHIRHAHKPRQTRCNEDLAGLAWTRNLAVASCRSCKRLESRARRRRSWRKYLAGVWLRCSCGWHTQRSSDAKRDCRQCGAQMWECERRNPKSIEPRAKAGRLLTCRCGVPVFERDVAEHACERRAA